jgi:hypothetical protein
MLKAIIITFIYIYHGGGRCPSQALLANHKLAKGRGRGVVRPPHGHDSRSKILSIEVFSQKKKKKKKKNQSDKLLHPSLQRICEESKYMRWDVEDNCVFKIFFIRKYIKIIFFIF